MSIVWRASPEGLEPGFLDDVSRFLADSPHTWYVLEALRAPSRSAALYEAYRAGQGPKAAPAGKSAHNWGLAIDVVPDIDAQPGLQPSWSIRRPEWRWLKRASIPHPRLTVGWRFGDWPHIQRYRWQRHRFWNGLPEGLERFVVENKGAWKAYRQWQVDHQQRRDDHAQGNPDVG